MKKGLGEYHDLYVQTDTFLLADVFGNSCICLATYELDATCFLTAPGLPWQVTLEKTKLKLDLLADNDMLLMVEKCIRGRICHAIH